MSYRSFTRFYKSIIKCTLASICVAGVVGMTGVSAYATGEDVTPVVTDGTQPAQTEAVPEEPEPIRVSIYESYNANYEMFEESMDDLFFFYCNVGNGAFSDVPVKFDIPANVSYVVEKDGEEIAYKAGDEIKDEGNYVMRLSAEYGGNTYEATFRFSIREALQTTNTSDSDSILTDLDDTDLDATDMTLDTDESISQEDIDSMIETAGSDYLTDESVSEYMSGLDVSHYTGFSQAYMGGRYTITLKSGENIISNVPNGAIINSGVSIDVPDTVTATIYRDGTEYTSSTLNFNEEGFYTVWFYASSVDYERFYPTGTVQPHITFRIINHAVNDMQVFNAPEGCSIREVDINGETYRDDNGNYVLDQSSFWMNGEGRYRFSIYEPKADATYDVEVYRDLSSPDISIGLARGMAYVQPECDDIRMISLTRNGKEIEYSGGNINGNGSYELRATDYAGNVATYSFTVTGGISKGTTIRIVLYTILIVASVVFLRFKHVSMKVR